MYDRPNLSELIDATRGHLEANVIPAIKGDAKLYFQTLVAINVLKVAERELALKWKHFHAEWSRLDALYGTVTPIPPDPADAQSALDARIAILSDHIRIGYFSDDQQAALLAHLLATTSDALEVANPKFLSATT